MSHIGGMPGGLAVAAALMLGACSEGRQAAGGDSFWAGTAPVEVAKGRGLRGPWRMNDSDFDYVDDPTVAIADDGHVAVAWVDQARKDVFLQVFPPCGPARFAEPVNLSSSPETFSWLPRLALADGGRTVHALWQEIVFSGGSHGGEIFHARSADGGATFSTPLNLSNSIAGDGKGRLTAERWDNGSLDLAVGPAGRVFAAWTEYEGRLLVSRSGDGGLSFSAPVHIEGGAARAARAPALAVDGTGGVHLAWSLGDGEAAEIRLAASRDGGQTFGKPQVVAAGGHADAPDIAADSRGVLHLVHAFRPAGADRTYRIHYLRRDKAGGGFSPARAISDGGTTAQGAHFPELALGGDGRLAVVWRLLPQGLGFALSSDGGRTFSPSETVPGGDDPSRGINGNLQGSLTTRLAANAEGSTALVGSTFASGRESRIWLWRKPAAACPAGSAR